MSSPVSSAPLIAEAVTKRYGGNAIVTDASLSLAPGTLTALLGPSGAGKSTLLRILAGLEPLDAGEVRLGDRLLSSKTMMVPAEKRRTGLIFQDYALFPHLTALGNIAFGLAHLSKSVALSTAEAWLDRLSLSHRSDAYPHQMSGGEQQRVAIARALAPDPDAILMDEPFSGLDPALETGVRKAALRALADAGKPALLVTHDPDAAMAMADQLAVMRNGHILQVAEPETIYRHPVDLGVARALAPIQTLTPDTCPPQLLSGLDMTEAGKGRPVLLGFREADIRIGRRSSEPTPAMARVEAVRFAGPTRCVRLSFETRADPLSLTALQPATDPAPKIGEHVPVFLAPQGRFIFDAE